MSHPVYSRVKKRSIAIDGRRTSISLEDEFWHRLRAIAYMARLDISMVVSVVNAKRGRVGLSSALRQFVLACHPQLASPQPEPQG